MTRKRKTKRANLFPFLTAKSFDEAVEDSLSHTYDQLPDYEVIFEERCGFYGDPDVCTLGIRLRAEGCFEEHCLSDSPYKGWCPYQLGLEPAIPVQDEDHEEEL